MDASDLRFDLILLYLCPSPCVLIYLFLLVTIEQETVKVKR